MKVTTEGILRDSMFQQANLVQQVVDGVQHLLLTPEVEEAEQPLAPVPAPPAPYTPPVQAANTVQGSHDIIPVLTSQMMQIQTMILDMQRQLRVSGGAPAPSPSPAPALSNRQRRARYYC